MKILLSGSSGLIGSAVARRRAERGDHVVRLVRRESPADPNEIAWDPVGARLEASALEGFDAVVHLAGENIAEGRWTAVKKARIRDSRVEGTRLLAEALARCSQPPRALVAASAIGFYGDRGDEELDETSAPGAGFLAEVCRAWEAAAEPAIDGGIRVVHLRIGMVLSADGGALAKMMPLFRAGLGGRLGHGRQSMSWIAIDDLVEAVGHAIAHEGCAGPVNAVAPQPVTNRQFTQTLARVLRRPAWFPAPAFALRILLGEMADELLLASARVYPRRLEAQGFVFGHPDLEGALRSLLRP
jgi:hypothetical protein